MFTKKKNLSRQEKHRKYIQLTDAIIHMQDGNQNDFPIDSKPPHWYARLWQDCRHLSTTTKLIGGSAIFLVALFFGLNAYETPQVNYVAPPVTKKDLESYKSPKSYRMKITLAPILVQHFKHIAKKHPHKAWRLKTTYIYQTRMQKCRALIKHYERQESIANRQYLKYNAKESHYFDSSNSEKVSYYSHLADSANHKKMHWHKKAKRLWRYRHRIRKIYHHKLHIKDKAHSHTRSTKENKFSKLNNLATRKSNNLNSDNQNYENTNNAR